MKFGCSIGIFLNSEHLICRSTDISKSFRGSLRLRDNKSRLYLRNFNFNYQITSFTYISGNSVYSQNVYSHLVYCVKTSTPILSTVLKRLLPFGLFRKNVYSHLVFWSNIFYGFIYSSFLDNCIIKGYIYGTET